MTAWVRRIGIAVVAAAAVIVTAVGVGTFLWHRQTAGLVGRLEDSSAARSGGAVAQYAATDLAGLPTPVARFFTYALTPGLPLIHRARIRWTGGFLMQTAGGWSPFTAEQVYVVHPPGYVWDASIRMTPLVTVHARDSYAAGVGRVHAKAASLYTVAKDGDTPEIAASALQRYLAECVFMPTALLPSAGIAWTPIDDSTARASLTDHGVTAIVQFHFGGDGAVSHISALRFRSTPGAMVPTPWVATVGSYRRVQGMMIPTSGEVEWELPEGRSPYWRGQVVSAAYQ